MTTATLELLTLPVAVNTDSLRAVGASVGDVSLAPPPVMVPAGYGEHPKPPFMIDRAEAYYWTAAWQDGVRDSLAALVAGKFRRFDSDDPMDLARWLLDDKEE
jgi:hypothetical protein